MNSACEGSSVKVIGLENIRLSQLIHGTRRSILLKNFGYSPSSRTNLVSLTLVQKSGIGINFKEGKITFQGICNGKVVMVGDSHPTGISELIGM